MTMTTAISMRDYFGIWSLSLLASIFLFLAPLSGRELGTRHRNNHFVPYVQSTPRQSLPVYTNVEQPAFPESPVLEIDILSDIVPSISRVPAQSLTVVLPVSSASSAQLPRRLLSLIGNSSATSTHFECLHEIIIVCPDTITSSLRVIATSLFSSQKLEDMSLPDLSLHPFSERFHFTRTSTSSTSLYHAAIEVAKSSVSTSWVLLLDERAFDSVSPSDQAILLNPPAISYAFGVLGDTWTKTPSVLSYWGILRSVSYITTPFVVSLSSLRSPAIRASAESSNIRLAIVTDHENTPNQTYTSTGSRHSEGLVLVEQSVLNADRWQEAMGGHDNITVQHVSDVVYFVLPSEAHLDALSPLVCNLRGAKIAILLYKSTNKHDPLIMSPWSRNTMKAQCTINYDVLTLQKPSVPSDVLHQNVLHWIKSTVHVNAVIFAVREEEILSTLLNSVSFKATISTTPIVIFIPEDELPYSDWISSLSITELKSMSDLCPTPPNAKKLTAHFV